MNTTPNDTNASPEALNTAALIGVIEMLVAPEFSQDFVIEVMERAGVEPTEDAINTVYDNINKLNKAVAAPLIELLPNDIRKDYIKE